MSIKPHCTICFKIGKEFNHTIRKNGVVTCPTVKNNVCSNCGKKGHFRDYCRNPQQQETCRRPIVNIPSVSKTMNRYVYDTEDSSDEEEDERVKETEVLPNVRLAPWSIGKPLRPVSRWAQMNQEDEE